MSNYSNEVNREPRLFKIILRKKLDFSGELGAVKKAPVNSQTIYASYYSATLPNRRVSISGTAVVGDIGLETWSSVTATLRQRFENQGWNLHNFSLDEGSGILSANVNINISADVSNQFSNQAHLDQAYRIFNAFTINYGVTTNRPFTSIDLRITGEEKPSYTAPKTTTISGIPKQQAGGSSNVAGNTNYAPPDAPFSLDKALTDLSKSLFGSMGSSTLLIAGVLGVILVLKR